MAESSESKELISKEVVESYIFSTVRHDFGIYSERLLLRLVELAQREINGLDFKGGTDLGKVHALSESIDIKKTTKVFTPVVSKSLIQFTFHFEKFVFLLQ